MPPATQVITGYVAGDTLQVKRTIPGVPAGRTLTKAWFTVKRKKADLDAAAALQLTITTGSTSSGQITDAGAGGTGALTFALSATQTAALGAGIEFQYDIQLKFDNADIATLETGTLTLDQGVTDATT